MGVASSALDGLLAELGMSVADAGGAVTLAGEDPVAPSRFPLLAAATASLGAQGVALARVWRLRGGRGQDITVDGRRAVAAGLHSIGSVLVNGHRPRATRAWSPQGYFSTADGRHICLVATHLREREIDGVLGVLGCQNNVAAVSGAVREWESVALEERLAAERLPGAVARTRDEWLAHPQGEWLAQRPVVEVIKLADGPPVPFAEPAERPLGGVRVLDATHVLAGPMTTRMLVEQGAQVLHVWSPMYATRLLFVLDTDVGKRSAYVDLDVDSGVEQFRRLAEGADVVVENWRPGSFDRRGLGPEALAHGHRGLVYVSISCYGSGGPWRDRGGYDLQAQAVTGIAATEGSESDPGMPPTFTLADYLAPYHAAAGVLSALARRATEGGSYHVRVSLSRSLMWLQELPLLDHRPDMSMPILDSSDFRILDTAFGALRIAHPLLAYSETPAYFERGCDPVGSSEPAWLPR